MTDLAAQLLAALDRADWSAVFIRTDRPAAAFALTPAPTPDDAEGKG